MPISTPQDEAATASTGTDHGVPSIGALAVRIVLASYLVKGASTTTAHGMARTAVAP